MGKDFKVSPAPDEVRMQALNGYLKKHSEALVKDVGIEAACSLTGKSKATLGRYYSENDEHADRFMPIDTVAQLEASSSFPHVTAALADLRGIPTQELAWATSANAQRVLPRLAALLGEAAARTARRGCKAWPP
jgi:hypothetical protein